jgi:phosphohistidine phosphatase
MQVHLLRHGTAEDTRPGGADSERKLTPAGREEVRRAIVRARPAGIAPTLIFSSPYVRAVETAEIAAAVVGYAGNILRTEALVPEASPRQVWQEIRGRPDESQILLAGHEPLLSQLMAYLLNAPSLRVDMRKATLLRIDLDRFTGEPSGLLKWMVTPDIWAA